MIFYASPFTLHTLLFFFYLLFLHLKNIKFLGSPCKNPQGHEKWEWGMTSNREWGQECIATPTCKPYNLRSLVSSYFPKGHDAMINLPYEIHLHAHEHEGFTVASFCLKVILFSSEFI